MKDITLKANLVPFNYETDLEKTVYLRDGRVGRIVVSNFSTPGCNTSLLVMTTKPSGFNQTLLFNKFGNQIPGGSCDNRLEADVQQGDRLQLYVLADDHAAPQTLALFFHAEDGKYYVESADTHLTTYNVHTKVGTYTLDAPPTIKPAPTRGTVNPEDEVGLVVLGAPPTNFGGPITHGADNAATEPVDLNAKIDELAKKMWQALSEVDCGPWRPTYEQLRLKDKIKLRNYAVDILSGFPGNHA